MFLLNGIYKKNIVTDFGLSNKIPKIPPDNNCKKNNNFINKFTGRKIRALIAVHLFGIPCKIKKLKIVCKKYRIKIGHLKI